MTRYFRETVSFRYYSNNYQVESQAFRSKHLRSYDARADLDDVDHLANLVPGELVDVEAELPLLVIAHGDGHVLLVRLVVQARA